MDERIGDWIETHTGIKFYPLDPRPEEIDIKDIAHALSMVCRFNGHCSKFFSVAEHSMSVVDLVEDQYKLQALLHDASEAYISDIARPIKRFLSNYVDIEKKLQDVIYKKFSVFTTEESNAAVNKADDIALATEAKYLIKSKGLNWNSKVESHYLAFPMCLEPDIVERIFLNEFHKCIYNRDIQTLKNNSLQPNG